MKKFKLLLCFCLIQSTQSFAQNVGISDQIFTPQSPLHIHGPSDGNLLQMTNPTTTNSAGRGLLIQALGNDFSIINNESGFIRFHTNNVERMRINAAGNVGIGTTVSSERLHVEGNVRFSGALMPNNNAGSPGSFLRSQGAGFPPVWSLPGLAVTNIITLNSTANLCVTGTTFTSYPGCTQTLALTAGQRVLAMAQVGVMPSNDCSGNATVHRSIVDVRIAVNGNDFPNGAWMRTSVDNSVGWVAFNSVSPIGEFTVPVTGSYTFALQARRFGGNGNAVTGGDATSALQATLILIIYSP